MPTTKVLVLPLARESLAIERRTIPTGQVHIHTKVRARNVRGEVPIEQRSVHVERVPKGEIVAAWPEPWRDGETLVIPVVEEELVVEKRLVLREELRVTTTVHTSSAPYDVELRSEELEIERVGPPGREDMEERAMEKYENYGKGDQLVVGLFDDESDARGTMNELVDAGIPKDDISLVTKGDTPGTEDVGFWDKVKSFFGFGISDEERGAYGEGLKRGGTLLSVRCIPENIDPVRRIMEAHDAVNIDERMAEWSGATAPMGAGSFEGTNVSGTNLSAASIQANARAGAPSNREAEVVVPVVEEELLVGKRQIERGGVRVYQRVSEIPVQEQVTLREEQVHVERVPVDRPIAAGEAAFTDRTYELTETIEEPVVSKQARVIEEVVVGREVAERTETIRDTVKRTDVEIQGAGGVGTSLGAADVDETAFRQHYATNFASRGVRYEDYLPAYHLGHELGMDPTFGNRSWDDVENEAERRWKARAAGGAKWGDIRDAVRHAFLDIQGRPASMTR
ncbi:DUF2382 domain-containing protein [Myxococcota bacterium]|nr:DUF2382 domain-containing protein [Myxococcota bacterium]